VATYTRRVDDGMRRLLAVLLLLSAGCVDIQEAVNYAYENNERVIKVLEQVKRATPEDSDVAPLVDDALWRAADRQRPWLGQLRRYEGPIVVEVPDSSLDRLRIAEEDRKLQKLTEDIDIYLSPPFGGEGGMLGGLGTLMGATGLGGGSLLLLLAKKLLKDNKNWKTAARHMFNVGNQIKDKMPEELANQFRQMAAANPIAKEMYQMSKTISAKEQVKNASDINAVFGNQQLLPIAQTPANGTSQAAG
jgi:hypothetical protein